MKLSPLMAAALFSLSPSLFAKDAKKILDQIKSEVDTTAPISLKNFLDLKNGKKLVIKNKRFYNSDVKRNLCIQDELGFINLEKEIIHSLEDAFYNKNSAIIGGITSGDFRVSGFLPTSFKTLKEKDGIIEKSWSGQSKLLTKKRALSRLTNYLNDFSKVDDVRFLAFQYYVDFDKRLKEDLSYNETQLRLSLDMRGVDSKNKRRHDRADFIAQVKKVKGKWKLDSLDLIEGKTLVLNRTPSFKEITHVAGADKVPIYLRREAIRRGGYGLSVADVNGDGHLDIFAGTSKKSALLLGSENEKFSIPTKHAFEREELVKAAIFADYDNDGDKDAIVTRFVPDNDDQDVVYYKNNSTGFERNPNPILNKKNFSYAMPAAVADFDRDGYLDFYVGFPGAKDFTFLGKENVSNKIWVEGLFRNNQKGLFEDKSEFLADNASRIKKSWQQVYPHSAMAVDFDQDGDSDLVVIDDRNNLSPVYKNVGKGKFKFNQVARDIGLDNDGYGMSIAAGDYDGDGLTDFAVTNVSFVASDRMTSSCAVNIEGPLGNLNMKGGVSIYKNLGNGKFMEVTKQVGLEFAGEGLAGLEFIDYNNDGHLDLYVSNGLWSGTDRRNDLSSLFVRSVAAKRDNVQNETLRERSQSDYMDVLAFFEGDVESAKKLKGMHPSMGGFQRNRLYRNEGNGTFSEVGYLEGADSINDGYIVAKADMDKDGRMDLVLRNGDPGSDKYTFPVIQVFKNTHKNKNSLKLKLIGSESNRDAIGAVVKISYDGTSQTSQLIATNGPAQSEMIMHFGLGKSKRVSKVQITWPSGKKQVIRNMKSGFHEVHEPSSKVASN